MKEKRFDIVGSFLRPDILKKARIDFENGKIGKNELKKIEDEAIKDLIEKQKKAGLPYITDGEFRRATWHLDFMWAFNGVGHSKTTTGLPFNGEKAMIDDTYLTGKISIDTHPFVEHFKFVKAFEEEGFSAKQTIPSPAQFYAQMTMPFAAEHSHKYYPDFEELLQDIANGYKKVIKDLYEAGCRTLQFDDCTWGMLVDSAATKFYNTDLEGLKKIEEDYLRINNLAIEGKPEDLQINTHVCRGNYHSTFASKGPYDAIAPILFGKENVEKFFLEYDDERSGGFAPLLKVSKNKKVVLGLVTTKNAKLENKDKIIERIKEASKYIPLERLYLSPQCGFASCEIGNKLAEEQQWAKIKLVREITEEVWK